VVGEPTDPGAPAGGTGAQILFLASTVTHVESFAPVIAVLAARGVGATVLTLDRWYGYGAWRAARDRGLRVVEATDPGAPARPFYRRGTLAIWRDVLAAHGPMAAVLGRSGARTIVVGNDSGLLEKLALTIAGRYRWRRILVQDGRLADQPRPSRLSARSRATLRAAASAALRIIGLPYLAASAYGSGDLSAICAAGPGGAATLSRRARRGVAVIITGQPRYDRLGVVGAQDATDGLVALFTSPFTLDGYGPGPQHAQTALAADLAGRLRSVGRTLAIKPHPREDASGYAAAIRHGAEVWSGDAADLLRDSTVAIIGLSTLVEEAVILGRPVVVPGALVHSGPLESLLPDRTAFPRFESVAEAVDLVTRLTSGAERERVLAAQSAGIAGQVSIDPDRPAAVRVADVVLGQ
jgi:hypothetical protein